MKRFDGEFIYTGHYLYGQEVGNGHVFQRVRTKSVPIEMQHGPAVLTEMVKDKSAEIFEETVADMLPRRIAHEIGRLLPD